MKQLFLLGALALTACDAGMETPQVVTPPPTAPAPEPTPPTTPPPAAPAEPTLQLNESSLIEVTQESNSIMIKPKVGQTAFVRLKSEQHYANWFGGEKGAVLNPTGLNISLETGLIIEARAPLGLWAEVARYDLPSSSGPMP